MEYAYPTYRIDLAEGLMKQCADLAPRLLNEAGLSVPNERFLSHLEGKSGIRIANQRVHFDRDLVKRFVDAYIGENTPTEEALQRAPVPDQEWAVDANGYSMMTIDVETEELREGTCQDLRDMIRLVNSFGVGGQYMIMPQDVPPLMRTLACFKICWETTDNIIPYDYQQAEQIPFLYEMHQVMGEPMDIRLTIPTAMTIDPKDLDIFLDAYPLWKKHGDFRFVIGNYAMMGILKPITAPGCATMGFCENLAAHILFKLFDPELELNVRLSGGHATDMRSACWAFGSPRAHLFRYLSSRILPNLCGVSPRGYLPGKVRLETSSPAIDELAGMEKMATGLVAALQGARHFCYAGTLCIDDVYSGTQFVIDLEIVNYIREAVECFAPHPDVIDADGLYEEMLDVCLDRDIFLAHPNTVKRFRNILPSSDLIVREKLRAWMAHHKTLKDRAREVALERLRRYESSFSLPDDKQRALDRIYADAARKLG